MGLETHREVKVTVQLELEVTGNGVFDLARNLVSVEEALTGYASVYGLRVIASANLHATPLVIPSQDR